MASEKYNDHTSALMWEILRTFATTCIVDFDVIAASQVVEEGLPEELAANPSSVFSHMLTAAAHHH
jgi:hypothetical protein